CANRMKVSGPAQFVDQFVVDCFSGADGLDFDKIIPMLKVLDGTSTGMSDAMGSDVEIGIEVLTRKRLRSPLGREESILDRELARKAGLKAHNDLEAGFAASVRGRWRWDTNVSGHFRRPAIGSLAIGVSTNGEPTGSCSSSSSIERKRRSTTRLPHHGRPPTRCITRWRAAIQRSKFGSRRSRKEMNSHTSSRQVAGGSWRSSMLSQ